MIERARRTAVQVRLSAEEHAVLLQAAARAGLDLSTWIRVVAANAAGRKKLEMSAASVSAGPRRPVAISMSPIERDQFLNAAARHNSQLAPWLRAVALAAAE